MPPSGSLLADRYRLDRRIAVGGMGEVWEATDTRLDRQVAVKVLREELSGDAEFASRFRAEARTTASLNHPGVAAVHDYGETVIDSTATAYLVMELVAGEPLAATIARQGRLPADQTLGILEQAGHALQAAHERGLVHRDVKPGNILITPTGAVKLTDFGIAKAVDAAPLTRTGMVMGTAHYIAPEQAEGSEAGPASDVYSLGVVGYECLAGQRPFRADSAVTVAMMHIRDDPPPLPADVPHGARSLIEATMAKDPQQRYATGGELARAAAAVRSGRPLPLPAGMAGGTAMLTGAYPTTAAMQPGAAQLRTGAQTDARQRRPAQERRGGGRASRWAVGALVLIAVLALGAWGVTAALQSAGTPPGATDTSTPPDEQEEPPPDEQAPTGQAPQQEAPQQEAPQQTTTTQPQPTTEAPDTVTVEEMDYLGQTGDETADQLEELGVDPRVVDGDGNEIGGGDQQDCRVTGVDPSGEVERDTTVTVSCVGAAG
ncbi:MAG: protein kinase [Pseudonocardiaceae bacterium]|nr:protein kinase [Pseudonocardiaceae bacterium]